MVRFAASNAADEADMRAERGKHIIYFEDGDSGPALRALTPFLSWGTDDGTDTLPYAEFFDIAGRSLRAYLGGPA